MKKITILLITLLMLTCFSSAASYSLKKTINGIGVVTTIPEGNSVTLTYVGEKVFAGWEIREGTASIANLSSSSITFIMPSNNLHIEAVTHTHSYGEATCTTPPTCSCGAIEGSALGHSWNAATCTVAKTCSRCSATEENALGHSWNAATCTTAKTCSVCGVTEGAALGHSYTGTRTCNGNGSTDTVKCIRCSATENQACTHIVLLSSKVSVGDYVDYPVAYANVPSDGVKYTPTLTGWRVIDVDTNGAVTLVSAGVPLTYVHNDAITGAESINALITNFLTTTYSASGFDSKKTLTELFTNKYTTGVRAMTLEDVESGWGSTLGSDTDISGNDLFGIPTNTGGDANYYLATQATSIDNTLLVFIDWDVGITEYDASDMVLSLNLLKYASFVSGALGRRGIRPVVTLATDVLTVDAAGTASDPYILIPGSCAHSFTRTCNSNGSTDTIRCSNCSYTETKACNHIISFSFMPEFANSGVRIEKQNLGYSITVNFPIMLYGLNGMTWQQWCESTYGNGTVYNGTFDAIYDGTFDAVYNNDQRIELDLAHSEWTDPPHLLFYNITGSGPIDGNCYEGIAITEVGENVYIGML